MCVDSQRVGRQLNGNGRRIAAFTCWLLQRHGRHGATSSATAAEPAANVGVVSPAKEEPDNKEKTNEMKKKRTCFTTFYFTPWSNSLSLRNLQTDSHSSSTRVCVCVNFLSLPPHFYYFFFFFFFFFGYSLHLGAPAYPPLTRRRRVLQYCLVCAGQREKRSLLLMYLVG